MEKQLQSKVAFMFWFTILALTILLFLISDSHGQVNDSLKYGQPKCDGTILKKTYYTVCYENDWKIPQWAAEHITSANLKGKEARTNDFRPDPAVAKDKQSLNSDYLNSGYDRGHQAPAGDYVFSKKAMSETFFLSNMAPQTPRLNRFAWKDLETEVRASVIHCRSGIWILTGPIFKSLPPEHSTGKNKVAIPGSFFKVVLCVMPSASDKPYLLYTFVLPNQKEPISGSSEKYESNVSMVEHLTGLKLFETLSSQGVLEEQSPKSSRWPIQ